jgi:hypothetical protein
MKQRKAKTDLLKLDSIPDFQFFCFGEIDALAQCYLTIIH